MLPIHIALVSESNDYSLREVSLIAAAIQKQITRDLFPIWKISATINAFSDLESVPTGYWPIVIRNDIERSATGVHEDSDGQPYALVQAGDETSLTCSHECLEMLVDPSDNRFVASQSIATNQGRVKYLVEICDPSEDKSCGYSINGVLVSDFYTPNYFDPVKLQTVRYSYTGAIQGPRELLLNGYLSWVIPETGQWWQATYFGEKITTDPMGKLARERGQCWREVLNSISEVTPKKKKTKKTGLILPNDWDTNSKLRADNLREDINKLLASK